jgi:hypothetical protein
MSEREVAYLLRAKIQMDDSYLGAARPGGKAGRESENRIPIVAAVSLNEVGHPIHVRITAMSGFSSEAIAEWAKRNLEPGSHAAGVLVPGGRYPSDLPEFRWINILLGTLKTSFNGTFHAFNIDHYARRYLGGYCFRFNRRFAIAEMTERIANALCGSIPCTELDLRVAEAYGSSSRILSRDGGKRSTGEASSQQALWAARVEFRPASTLVAPWA